MPSTPPASRFLNPETSGETLAFTGLTVVVFLLLLVLLLLLLRNILKLYADQSSSALGARLRTRMVLGAALIALTPAVFMFLFSFQLMNRSIDRWFSPNTSELREDSTRVVLELAQYVTSNARGEAESIAASGAVDGDPGSSAERSCLASRHPRGRFRLDLRQRPSRCRQLRSPAGEQFGQPHSVAPGKAASHETSVSVPLHGPLSASILSSAQRNDEPVIRISGQEYALGQSQLPLRARVVIAALPMPQGLSQTTARIRAGASRVLASFPLPQQHPHHFLPAAVAHHGPRVLLQRVAGAVSVQADHAPCRSARPMPWTRSPPANMSIASALVTTGEMGELVRSFNHMAADLDASRQLAETSSAQLTAANQAIEERRRELETILETIPSGVVTLDCFRNSPAGQSRLCGADGSGRKCRPSRPEDRCAVAARSSRRTCRPHPSRPSHGRRLH